MDTTSGKHHELTMALLGDLLPAEAMRRISVRLWDGSMYPDAGPRAGTLVLNHPGALRNMLQHGDELELGEAYLYNDFDIEGDVEAIFDLEDLLTGRGAGLLGKIHAAGLLHHPPQGPPHPHSRRGRVALSGKPHSMERDRQAIAFHYDVSNEFYALWLDRNMVYSCGYFRSPDTGLDDAQEAKLDMICRKLRLMPGQRLLDIGCGWGGLALHAARRYGVDATGITLSERQVEYANARIERAGLAHRCRVRLQDYRELPATGDYDALVSVGMFEHVGRAMLPVYFHKAKDLLRPGGVFLNHGIASRPDQPRSGKSSFADAYVFPDGELEPVSTVLREAENSGLEVRDVESLREHYRMTLRHWVHRLERRHDEALAFVDEPTYRVWRLYMAGSAHGFAVGRLSVFQSLLAMPTADGRAELPLTREDWYDVDRHGGHLRHGLKARPR